MTAQFLQDLLAPPDAAAGQFVSVGVDRLAELILQRFRAEERSPPAPGAAAALTAEAEEAAYAWGVVCYEQGRYADAAALFGAVQRRGPPVPRLSKALGAVRLAQADAAGAATAYAQAARLDPSDAESTFHQAQVEVLRHRLTDAHRLLAQARQQAQASPAKWPGLLSWCDELQGRLDLPPSP
jgi:predicted Zn-dependent protease